MTANLDKKALIKWAIAIAATVAILCIPTTEVFTWPLKLFLAITLFAILTFAFETLNQTMMALLLPFLYIVFNVAPSATALSPWTQTVPWMMISGLILANVLQSIGLLRRVAYKCIVLTGASYTGIIFGIGIAGLVLNIMIPSQALVPLATLAFGICTALEYKCSPEAAGIMLAAAMASQIPTNFLLSPNIMIIYGIGAEAAGSGTTSWLQFLFHNCPNIIYYFILLFVIARMFKPKEAINRKEYFAEEYKKMGKMTAAEKKGIVICALLFILLLTQSLHNISANLIFIIVPLFSFLPGINIGKPDDIKKANFPFIIFVTACMSIGSVAGYLGFGDLVSSNIMPLLNGKSTTVVLVGVWVMIVAVNFLLTPLAIQSTFTVPLTTIAMQIGINPEAMWMVILHGSDQILLPYEYPLYMLFFSYGLMSTKDFSRFFSRKMLINLLFLVLIFIPYWKLIGFLYI